MEGEPLPEPSPIPNPRGDPLIDPLSSVTEQWASPSPSVSPSAEVVDEQIAPILAETDSVSEPAEVDLISTILADAIRAAA